MKNSTYNNNKNSKTACKISSLKIAAFIKDREIT